MRRFHQFPAPTIKNAAITLLITCLLLVVIEGLGSVAIGLVEASHTYASGTVQYDESLGWINTPNAYRPDKWGPGKYIRINSRGFRSDVETPVEMLSSKARVICSGDSFTFGEGVANDSAWCHLLSRINDRFETVNLGQVGYGVDQMYLRYLRDGVALEHSIHIMAFIYGDLSRMRYADHHGTGRPTMRVERDVLVVTNVPIPKFRWSVSRAIKRADLRSLDFIRRVVRRLSNPAEKEEKPMLTDINVVGPVAAKIFRALEDLSSEKKIVSVFVYLPTERDLREDLAWRTWTAETMHALNLNFIDLTPALSALPAGTAARFFIDPWRPAKGHYTEAGNEWVAETLNERLLEIPQIRDLLPESKLGTAQISRNDPH